MAHCLALKLLFFFALCGTFGCSTTRSTMPDEFAARVDQRLSDLETRNRTLEQQINQLKVDSSDKDRKLSELQDTLSTISPEASTAPARPNLSESHQSTFRNGIEKALAIPLQAEETKEQR